MKEIYERAFTSKSIKSYYEFYRSLEVLYINDFINFDEMEQIREYDSFLFNGDVKNESN